MVWRKECKQWNKKKILSNKLTKNEKNLENKGKYKKK